MADKPGSYDSMAFKLVAMAIEFCTHRPNADIEATVLATTKAYTKAREDITPKPAA